MIGYCFVNFGASAVISKFVEKEREEAENNAPRVVENKLSTTGPQQTVVTKMMKNLENYKYNEANEKARQTEMCAVCMDEFTDDAETCELSCNATHIFHSDCIKDWFYQ